MDDIKLVLSNIVNLKEKILHLHGNPNGDVNNSLKKSIIISILYGSMSCGIRILPNIFGLYLTIELIFPEGNLS
jgi:hypothetical protein